MIKALWSKALSFDLWWLKGRNRVWHQHWITMTGSAENDQYPYQYTIHYGLQLSADLWALRPPGRRGRSCAVASPAQPQVLLDPSEIFRSCSIGRQPLRRAAGSPPSSWLLQLRLASQRSSEVCAAELLPSQLRGAAPVEVLHTPETFPAWSGSPQQLCWVSFDACTS